MPTFGPKEHLRTIERTSERHEGREEFVCLDRNERVSALPEETFRALLGQLKPRDLMAYPDAGRFVAKLAGALDLPEDWIAETNGSDSALRRVFMAFLRPGDGVVTLQPSYAMYELYTRIFQGMPRPIGYRKDRSCDIDELLDAIQPGVGLVVIAHPDQPVGTAVAPADVRRIVARSADVGAICVVDEAYHPFYPITVLPLVKEFNNLFVTRSFSKYPGCAGIRLGFAAAVPPLIKGLMSVRGGNEVSSLSLAIGCYLIDHPAIAERFREAVEEGRRLLLAEARKLGFKPLPCVTNFALLECPESLDPRVVVAQLRDSGYLVKGGFTSPILARCIRVSLNGPDIMIPFVRTLRQVMHDISVKTA
jgi:histidinol-phosphate aminotransferase